MNAQHTPGPYVVERTPIDSDPDLDLPDNCPFWIVGPGDAGEVLALVLDTSRTEAEANALLFAAAPELLAACKALIDAPHHDHFAARLGDEELAAVDAIRAAIAKAEGCA